MFISTDALHFSGGSSAHHQEHISVHTASGIVNCNNRVKWIANTFAFKISDKTCMVKFWVIFISQIFYTNLLAIHLTLSLQMTIPEAVCTVMCSWWWAEEPPETCRASVEINKSNKRCILLVVIWNPASKLIVLKAVYASVPLRLIGLSFPTWWFSVVTDDTSLEPGRVVICSLVM